MKQKFKFRKRNLFLFSALLLATAAVTIDSCSNDDNDFDISGLKADFYLTNVDGENVISSDKKVYTFHEGEAFLGIMSITNSTDKRMKLQFQREWYDDLFCFEVYSAEGENMGSCLVPSSVRFDPLFLEPMGTETWVRKWKILLKENFKNSLPMQMILIL